MPWVFHRQRKEVHNIPLHLIVVPVGCGEIILEIINTRSLYDRLYDFQVSLLAFYIYNRSYDWTRYPYRQPSITFISSYLSISFHLVFYGPRNTNKITFLIDFIWDSWWDGFSDIIVWLTSCHHSLDTPN